MSSRASTEALKTLEPIEHVPGMEARVSEMRRNSEWRRRRADVRGAVMLADESPEAARVLRRFVSTLQDRHPWLSKMIQEHDLGAEEEGGG